MAIKMSSISLILLVVLMLCNRATAQSSCTMALVSLSPCINYVTGNSSTPSSSCCSRLSSVVDSQPQCLCALLKGGSSNLGIAVNQTLALALPGACNVQTPPVSRCGDGNGAGTSTSAPSPAVSPSVSPVDETPDVPTDNDIPSGAGSKTVPRTDGSTVSGSNNIGGSRFSFSGALVLIASSSLAFF